jgi:hypothetical protein
VRADDHNKIKGKPGAKLQQETIKQIKREEKSDDKKAKGKK